MGEITDRQIQETPLGQIARREWLRLPTRFTHIQLDTFVVMTNPIHGIIVIPGMGMGVDFQDAGLAIPGPENSDSTLPLKFGENVLQTCYTGWDTPPGKKTGYFEQFSRILDALGWNPKFRISIMGFL